MPLFWIVWAIFVRFYQKEQVSRISSRDGEEDGIPAAFKVTLC